jgi:hypothetical protein
VADFAAAYPEAAGVRSLTRRFAWDGAAGFRVTDEARLGEAKPAEWHLQSDTPFRRAGDAYVNGAGLRVTLIEPKDAAVELGRATVKSPGPPGAIETGPEEERGYRLSARTPAATAIRFEVELLARR